eukprot:2710675-Amphidinium_carterae.1
MEVTFAWPVFEGFRYGLDAGKVIERLKECTLTSHIRTQGTKPSCHFSSRSHSKTDPWNVPCLAAIVPSQSYTLEPPPAQTTAIHACEVENLHGVDGTWCWSLEQKVVVCLLYTSCCPCDRTWLAINDLGLLMS